MGVFSRVQVPAPAEVENKSKPQAIPAAPSHAVIRAATANPIPKSDLPPVAPERPKAPPKAVKKPVDVESILWDALDKHGAKVKRYGADWIRIPAVWRGSREYNVSVHATAGFAIDFPDNAKRLDFNELMELLEHKPGDIQLVSADKINVQNSAQDRRRDAQNLWRKGTDLTRISMASRIARRYLVKRGIPESTISRIAGQIRAVPGEFGGATLLLPIFQPSKEGVMIGVQRIFLNSQSEKYGEDPKRMLGSHFDGDRAGGFLIAGDRTRFQSKEVAVVEGFETGLAVSAATGMPVYVLYTANGVRGVHLDYLSSLGVESVLFAEDNDDPDKHGRRAGQEATDFTAGKMHAMNIPCRRATPVRSMVGNKACDWLDIFVKDRIACARLLLNALPFVPKPKPQPKVRPAMANMYKP
ncbi:toprim domain-containing protein [Methylobacillus sp. Pita2]|uniref:toprim domain-containing protein n=1 Tax=Methylobacillus sp. Pita2 TaxID=3383245 RepID=UPI0038B65E90